MSVPPPPPLPNRWLLKDIDYFAGFAHAVHTYLGGVALAGAHGLSLLHQPFMSAHGMGYHFDDFLMGDERGLVEPLAAPELGVSLQAQLVIGGRPITIGTVQRTGSAAQVTAKLLQAPADSLTHVRKGRFAFVDENKTLCVNCTITPESRYAALWLRERFWRATRARERRAASNSRSNVGAGGVADAKTVTIAIHVRRGDVTYLDKYSRPSSRWVETTAMLEVLRGVCSVLGVPLARPAVRVHLFSEAKGWQANDTAALRAVAPHAELHLDSSPSATIDALILMSRADVLLMGASGFSNWAAIFSCGVKIGPAHRPMLPMRHVPYSNTLVAYSGPFETAALPAFRATWDEYVHCKQDAACRRTLCAPERINDPRWQISPLAKSYATQPLAAQWHVPTAPPLTTTLDEQTGVQPGVASRARADGRSVNIDGWLAARDECVRAHGADPAKVTVCTRSKWTRKLKAAFSLKERLALAAAANRSSDGIAASGGAVTGTGGSAAHTRGTMAARTSKLGHAGAGGGEGLLPWPTKSFVRDGVTHVTWARA